jgi:hypothetical protein
MEAAPKSFLPSPVVRTIASTTMSALLPWRDLWWKRTASQRESSPLPVLYLIARRRALWSTPPFNAGQMTAYSITSASRTPPVFPKPNAQRVVRLPRSLRHALYQTRASLVHSNICPYRAGQRVAPTAIVVLLGVLDLLMTNAVQSNRLPFEFSYERECHPISALTSLVPNSQALDANNLI